MSSGDEAQPGPPMPRRRSSAISPTELYTARISRAVLTTAKTRWSSTLARPVSVSVAGRPLPDENGSADASEKAQRPRRPPLVRMRSPNVAMPDIRFCPPTTKHAPSPLTLVPYPTAVKPPHLVVSPAPDSVQATPVTPPVNFKQLAAPGLDHARGSDPDSPFSSSDESFFCRGIDTPSPTIHAQSPDWPSPSPAAFQEAPKSLSPGATFFDFGETPVAAQFRLTRSPTFDPAFSFGRLTVAGTPEAREASPRTKRGQSISETCSPSKRRALSRQCSEGGSYFDLVATDSCARHPFASSADEPPRARQTSEANSIASSSAASTGTAGSGVSWLDVMHDELWPPVPIIARAAPEPSPPRQRKGRLRRIVKSLRL